MFSVGINGFFQFTIQVVLYLQLLETFNYCQRMLKTVIGRLIREITCMVKNIKNTGYFATQWLVEQFNTR